MLEMGVDRVGASSVGLEGQGAALTEERQGRARLHVDLGVELTMARRHLGWVLECHRRQWNGKAIPSGLWKCHRSQGVRRGHREWRVARLGWRL